MAVDPLALRPRTAVAIVDGALRLCSTSTGPWLLTLPAGVVVAAALLHLADAVRFGRALGLPVAFFTAAWLARALAQGAACHFIYASVLGSSDEPSPLRSAGAALRRAPSLIIAATYLLALDTLLLLFTGGLGFLFVSAHTAGYAVVMRGQGHPLRLAGTCARLLGAARRACAGVRAFGLTQPVAALNLHVTVTMLLWVGANILGLDLAYAQRFASLDNVVWLLALAVIVFTVFEPLRAATATLLLIDGRIRQEGLDLLAQVERLPLRRRARSGSPAASLSGAALVLALALPAQGAPRDTAELRRRLEAVLVECELTDEPFAHRVQSVDHLGPAEQASLGRFVATLERRAFEDCDCDAVRSDARAGLAEIHALDELETPEATATPQGSARAILERPEFQAAPQAAPDEPKPEAETSGIEAWLDAVLEWLRKHLFDDADRQRSNLPDTLGDPRAGAAVVAVLVGLGALALLGYILWRWREARRASGGETGAAALRATPLLQHQEGALARRSEAWLELADALAAKGEFREAIRHLYLALLSRLHHDGLIDYEPTWSNWDALATFRGAERLKGVFRELTRRFDFAWYGRAEGSHAAYRAFRELAGPLLEAGSTVEAGHA